MKKKILLPLVMIFASFFVQGQITLTTTSSSGNWSPSAVTNTGDQLTWTAADNTAAGGTFAGQIVNANDPTFDFSSNNGTPVEITITNTGNDFSGLTTLSFNGGLQSGDISVIDIANATSLKDFGINYNNLSILDLTQNVALEALNIRGNQQLLNQTLDVSNNSDLRVIVADNSGINALDVSNNSQINDIRLYGARLTSEVMDQLLIDLDNHGLSNGNIEIRSQKGGDVLTYQSKTAYLSLISKGWSIDVPEPPAEDIKTITLITNASSSAWRLDRVYNYGAVLHWEATNSLIGTITADQYDNEIAPTFDFSANDGSPITITITSNEGFNALDQLNLNNEVGNINSEITNVDIANALNLGSFAPFNSSLTDVDVSNNSKLYRILIHGDVRQLVGQTLNTNNNPEINHIRIDNTGIVSVDFTNNPLLLKVWLMNASLTSSVMDNVVITLDQHGKSNGDLRLASQTTGDQLTSASLAAYNNLINKGWTIDVGPPSAIAGVEIDITGNSTSIPGDGSNTPRDTDNTDFGAVAENGTITQTFSINSLGDTELNLTGSTLVDISGADAADFSVSQPPATPVAANGGSTTFEITFTAPVGGGVKHAVLIIANDDPDEGTYTFNIQATSLINGPDIDVQGNGITIINGDTTPDITDDTDFGQVINNTAKVTTYTIKNKGIQDLTVTGIGFSFGGDPEFQISSVSQTLPYVVTPGSDITFDVSFAPTSTGSYEAFIQIDNSDTNKDPYQYAIAGEGVVENPSIDVQGNAISIVNGDTTPDVSDDTDFRQSVVNSTKTTTYTILNNGVGSLTVSGIGFTFGSDSEFSISATSQVLPATILPGGNMTFDVSFTPSAINNYQAFIQIDNSDTSEDPYNFAIAGEGVDVLISGDIMITQYYSGFSGNDNWVEVKNLSGAPISSGTYVLALYDQDDIPNISSSIPTDFVSIPAMGTDEVVLFRNSSSTLPSAGNIGTAQQITTSVCNFDGNDVILISTSSGATCYANRQDIIGDSTVPVTTWGRDKSLIKGGCATEIPHAVFDEADWINILPLEDVDTANPNTNIALGTQVIGPTTYDGSGNWTNLEADQSRTVVFNTSFNHANINITACNLTINGGVNVVYDSNGAGTNTLEVYGDLIVDGTLTIGDTESLLTVNPNANLGVITKIEKSELLYNLHDNTYWSSPVTNALVQNIFPNVNPDRIFEYRPGAINPIYNIPGYESYIHWFNKPTGSMDTGYGYAAEGPAEPVDTNDNYITPLQHFVSFTGVPNNGTLSPNIYYKGSADVGSENDNFNLFGNPYPTAIDILLFLNTNTAVNEIALWTHSTPIDGNTSGNFTDADYVYYNQSGSSNPPGTVTSNIGSGQGFMIRSISSGNINFYNEFKISGANDQFFKSNKSKSIIITTDVQKDRIWLELKNDKYNKANIMVGFLDDATDDVDIYFDSYGYNTDKKIGLYSNIKGSDSKYLIQGLGKFSDAKRIKLGFDTKEPGKFELNIVGIEGKLIDSDVYLLDNLLGVTHNLKDGPYTFEQKSAGEFKDRFTLQFATTALGVDDFIKDNDFSIANSDNGFNINASKIVSRIKVYDMLGRLILQQKPDKQSFNVQVDQIKQGTVLIFEVTLDNGAILNKKTIRY